MIKQEYYVRKMKIITYYYEQGQYKEGTKENNKKENDKKVESDAGPNKVQSSTQQQEKKYCRDKKK